jgi:FRG domain
MPPTRHEVSTIEQFSEWVWEIGEQFTRDGFYEAAWFRGAGDEAYHLVPGLYRTDKGKEEFADSELRAEFMRRALPFVAERPPRNEWEWYFLMQHYRAPTRLLDWTDSALVALYFALGSMASPLKPGRHPAVWAMNPFTLNRHSHHGAPVGANLGDLKEYLPRIYSEEKLPGDPIGIDPNMVVQRMVVQRSHFTIHGSERGGIDERAGDLGLKEDLLKAVILFKDQDDLDYLFRHLSMLGITETSIFPDLEGLARELRMEYRLDISRNTAPQ